MKLPEQLPFCALDLVCRHLMLTFHVIDSPCHCSKSSFPIFGCLCSPHHPSHKGPLWPLIWLRITAARGAKFPRCSESGGWMAVLEMLHECFVGPQLARFSSQSWPSSPSKLPFWMILRHEQCRFEVFSSELRGIIHAAGAGGSFQATSWSTTTRGGAGGEQPQGLPWKHRAHSKVGGYENRYRKRTDSLLISRF